MFKGIPPPSQFPATVASGAPPRPNHACCEERVHVCFETLWRRGGGVRVCNARNTFFYKKILSTHYARTPVVHRVHQRAACPSWGSPPWGLKITPAFSGIPKEKGTKSELAGPTSGRKCYITHAFSGIPTERGTKSELDA